MFMMYIKCKKEVAGQCDYYEPKNSLKEKGKFSQCLGFDCFWF